MCKSLSQSSVSEVRELGCFQVQLLDSLVLIPNTTGSVLVVIRYVLMLLPGNNHFLHATQVWKVVFRLLPSSIASVPHFCTGAVPRYCVDLSISVVWLVCRLDPNTALPSVADLETASAAGRVCMNVCDERVLLHVVSSGLHRSALSRHKDVLLLFPLPLLNQLTHTVIGSVPDV
jgi:hypothetical protein